MRAAVPDYVNTLIAALEQSGHEAYIVGGCVRDGVMGREPADWDVCTSAPPHVVKAALPGYKTVDTGIKHGTVRVVTDAGEAEITTFRVDGDYSDSRRPDSVRFTPSLQEDLSRRDFTINAMAWSEKRGLIDPFGGQSDIERRLIRCVGEPDSRFREDALRIMRALRFSARLGFSIETRTLEAMAKHRAMLRKVSGERIGAELASLLTGEYAADALKTAVDSGILGEIIPEFIPVIGMAQHNPNHDKTVSDHIIATVRNSPPDLRVRLAMLLHDIGKGYSFSMDENGVGHFYGHARESERMARDILSRLRFPGALIDEVCVLIRAHGDKPVCTAAYAKRLLRRLGVGTALRLMQVKRADALSKAPGRVAGDIAALDEFGALLDKVIEEDQCFSLKQLAVNGDDLIARGEKPGRKLGLLLEALLAGVIDGSLPNERDALLEYARNISGSIE